MRGLIDVSQGGGPAQYVDGELTGIIPCFETRKPFDMNQINALREMFKSPGWLVMLKLVAAEQAALGQCSLHYDCDETPHKRFQGEGHTLDNMASLAQEVERTFDSMCELHKQTEEAKKDG